MPVSPQIQARINEIAKELANGGDTSIILQKFTKKYKLGKDAINKYIRQAKPIAQELRAIAEKAAAETIIEETKAATKIGLRSVMEYDNKLEKIIFRNHKLIRDPKTKNVLRVDNTVRDQLMALNIYYKRHGHYSPEKQEVNIEGSFLDFLKQVRKK
jgi:hypothetical protein